MIDILREKLKNQKIQELIDEVKQIRKRKADQQVKTLAEEIQNAMYWAGAYDMQTGDIEVGSLEEETADTVWHEFLHKYLFEKESLEAGIMWDNIAKAVEKHIGLRGATKPFIFSLPPKKAKITIREHKDLFPDVTFGLGITTYKSGEVSNYTQAAKEVAETVKKELISQFADVKLIEDNIAIGIYKGGKEPSYAPVLKGKLTDTVRSQIKSFKEKYHQESVILYQFGGIKQIGIEIGGIPETSITELQERITKATGGKIGEFLTYTPEKKRVTIINIPEFDSMNREDFTRFFPAIRTAVREMKGSFKTLNVNVEVL